jgi:Phage protein Gp9.
VIKEYLNQTVTLKETIGYNEYGEPVSSEKAIPCRFERKRKLVRDKQGNEVVSEATMYCIEPISPDDRVVYNGKEYVVISILEAVDLDGNIVYYEVAL